MSVSLDSNASLGSRTRQRMLFAGLVVVLLASADLLFACTYWRALHGVPPARIAQNIAAGLLGMRAFAGGSGTVALGVLLHYGIMAVMVGVYYLAARRMAALSERPWLFGALYGVMLFIVMNLLVLPLSAVPKVPVMPGWIASSVVVHVIIGLVIALTARHAMRE